MALQSARADNDKSVSEARKEAAKLRADLEAARVQAHDAKLAEAHAQSRATMLEEEHTHARASTSKMENELSKLQETIRNRDLNDFAVSRNQVQLQAPPLPQAIVQGRATRILFFNYHHR